MPYAAAPGSEHPGRSHSLVTAANLLVGAPDGRELGRDRARSDLPSHSNRARDPLDEKQISQGSCKAGGRRAAPHRRRGRGTGAP